MEHTVSLTVRAVVGLMTAYVVAFLGMIAGSLVAPPISDDWLPLLARVVIIGLGASTGATVAWFNLLLDRRKFALLSAASLAGGVAAGLIAFFWSDAFTGRSDLYIRVREITQSTVIGAAIGANVLPLIVGLVAPRHWRS